MNPANHGRPILLAVAGLTACGMPSAELPAPEASGTHATTSAAAPPPSSPAASSAASPPPTAAASASPDPPQVVVDPAPSAEGAPAALYAELFSLGARWEISARYTVESSKSGPSKRQTAARGECIVAAVEHRRWALVSQITCRGLDAEAAVAEPFGGYWAATAMGLFHFAQDPGSSPLPLTRTALVLMASPSPENLVQNDPGYRFGPVWFHDVSETDGAWCSSQGTAGGDTIQARVCISAKRGFTAGGAVSAIGMTAYSVDLGVKRFVAGRPPPTAGP